MKPSTQLVAFTLDDQRFALDLATVARVIHAVEVTPLPQAPPVLHGIVNIHGELFTVINLRRRFGLPMCEIRPSDSFILAEMPIASTVDSASQGAQLAPIDQADPPARPKPTRKVALVVDAVSGVLDVDFATFDVDQAFLAHAAYVQGVVKIAEDLILIHDLAQCLSLQEEQMLHTALLRATT